MYTAKSIRIMDKKRRELFKTNEFRERLLEDLIEAIKTKKDVYLFSYNLTDEENNYTKEEDENKNVNYYAWLTEEEMTEIQRELFIHFWVGEEEDMDYLHLSLDYVASENVTEDTIIDDVYYYNRLFMFWSK